MDQNLIYAKTPLGDEAVRQSTRVVQRNLRMVLVQVDGKLSVAELAGKIGNLKLVEKALGELEEGGFITPQLGAPSVWEETEAIVKNIKAPPMSMFSTFEPRSSQSSILQARPSSLSSNFSAFGKPILPANDDNAKETFSDFISSEKNDRPRIDAPRALFGRLKWLLLVVLAIPVLGLATLLLYPYQNHKQKLEGLLGHLLQAPVRVGSVVLAWSPLPTVTAKEIKVGERGDSRVDALRLGSPFGFLWSGQQNPRQVEIVGAKFSPGQIAAMAKMQGDPGVLPEKVLLKDIAIGVAGGTLQGLAGELATAPSGRPIRLALENADRTLRMVATPGGQGWTVGIEGFGWAPFGNPAYQFQSLQAKAELQGERLLVHDMDSVILGGVFKGNWSLDWNSGLAMNSELALARINLKQLLGAMFPALHGDGELSGTLRVRASGDDWGALWRRLEGGLDLEIARGQLVGLDIAEPVRRGGTEVIRGGRTRFDRLTGHLRFNGDGVTGTEIKLDAGLMTAAGSFQGAADGKVDGAFAVLVGPVRGAGARAPVKVIGILPELSTLVGR